MTLAAHPGRNRFDLKQLVGSGDRIALVALPFIVAGVVLNVVARSAFGVGGPPAALWVISLVVLVLGVLNWAWCVWLLVTHVPRGQLITHGPYAVARHPLYTGVAFLVLPWIGFLFDSWLGVVVGIAVYAGARRFAPAEEKELATSFGAAWDTYRRTVLIPWL